MFRRGVLCLCVVFAGAVPSAMAQTAQPDRSVWGFSGSFVPKWETPSSLEMLFAGDTVDVTGSEFRAGVVRGRPFGGDWGVSFVRKKFNDGSFIADEPFEACYITTCFTDTSTAAFQQVTVTGIEVHKFIPFATIKRRAQIGLTVAGGIGSWKGTALVAETSHEVEFRGNNTVVVVPRHDVESVPAQELFVLNRSTIPLGRLELAGAAILSQNFKVRVSGGMNFPGTQRFSIQGIYLLPQ